MLVLGLDPGSRCTGVGLVAEESGVLRLVLARAFICPREKNWMKNWDFFLKS